MQPATSGDVGEEGGVFEIKVHRERKKTHSRTLDLQFRTIDNTGTDQLNGGKKKILIHPECCILLLCMYIYIYV